MSNLIELTARLIQALDVNCDVLDKEAVIKIITELEVSTITKEQLEATRLAKYINQLRRRTKDDGLSRRCKTLLKAWRQMVGISNQAANPPLSSNTGRNIIAGSSGINATGVLSAENSISTSFTAQNMDNNKMGGSNTTTLTSNAYDNDMDETGLNTNSQLNFANFLIDPHRERQTVSNNALDITDSTLSNSVQRRCASPVIIDIHDSNSSNLTSLPPNSNKEFQQQVNINNFSSIPTTGTAKVKKNKKDKKNKERRDGVSAAQSGVVAAMNPHLQQQQQQTNITRSLNLDDRSRFSNMFAGTTQPNVSEILSLSNSSMSSNFPPADNTSGLNRNLNRTNVASELSFAGKFQQGCTIFNQMTSPVIGGGNSNERATVTATNKGTSSSSLAAPYNLSNESSSNSHISHVGGMDFQDKINKNNKLHMLEQQQQQKMLLQQHDKNLLDNQQQQQPSQLLVNNKSINALTIENLEEKKVPKKRGRKKGSRGVDSIISNDTSLSSQMLQLKNYSSVGGTKKVKTTKELYAEMQNRKIANNNKLSSPAINFLNSPSRPASSCSEISNHSSRTLDATRNSMSIINAIHSDSETRDSSSIVTNLNHNNNNTNKIDEDCTAPVQLLKAENRYETANKLLKQKLLELIDGLPELVVPKDPAPCTCSIEIREKSSEGAKTKSDKKATEEPALSNDTILQEQQEQVQQQTNKIPTMIESFKAQEQIKPFENYMNDLKATATITPAAENVTKPKKSIFDFDFDDDDDPLLELKAEIENKAKKAEEEAKLAKERDENSIGFNMDEVLTEDEKIKQEENVYENYNYERSQATQAEQPPQPPIHIPEEFFIQPTLFEYIIKEDANCLAKKKQIATQQITEFHINALHNYYIPNVNGNWNAVKVYQEENNNNSNINNSNKNNSGVINKVVGNYHKVDFADDDDCIVPSYGALMKNKLPKYFPELESNKMYKPDKEKFAKRMENSYKLPFLGVARGLLEKKLKLNQRKPKQKKKKIIEQNKELLEDIIGNENNDDVVDNIPLTETLNLETTASFKDAIITEEVICRKDVEEAMDTSILSTNNNNYDNFQISCKTKADDDLLTKESTEFADIYMLEDKNDQQGEMTTTASNIVANDLTHVGQIDAPKVDDNVEHDNAMSPKDLKRSDSASSNGSNNSNTSLKLTQQSINLKLKQHRLLQQQQQHDVKKEVVKQEQQKVSDGASDNDEDFVAVDDIVNNKKRKRECDHDENNEMLPYATDAYDDDKIENKNVKELHPHKQKQEQHKKIKRIKIAINGDIATQRQISYNDNMSSSNASSTFSNDDEDDDDDGNDNKSIELKETKDELQQINNDNDEYEGDVDNSEDGDEEEEEEKRNRYYNYEDDEDDDCDDNENFHEVISHNDDTTNKHIVLTIKKLNRKSNSSSPLPTVDIPTTSTSIAAAAKPSSSSSLPKTIETVETTDNVSHDFLKPKDQIKPVESNSSPIKGKPIHFDSEESRLERQRQFQLLKERNDYLKKRLEKSLARQRDKAMANSDNNGKVKRKRKLHKELFQPHELYPVGHNKELNSIYGHYHEKLFDNISSCSSDCDTCSGSDNDNYNDDLNDTSNLPKFKNKVRRALNNLRDTSVINKKLYENDKDKNADHDNNNTDHDDGDDDDENDENEIEDSPIGQNDNNKENDIDNELNVLPEHNNGFLASFNKIYPEYADINELDLIVKHIKLTEETTSTTTTTTNDGNCEANNNDGNDAAKAKSSSIKTEISTKSSITSIPQCPCAANSMPRDEYVTGKIMNEELGEVQDFREWYQVLQIPSYQGELLTVMPYVILD